MTAVGQGTPIGAAPGSRYIATGLCLVGAVLAVVIAGLLLVPSEQTAANFGLDRQIDATTVSLLAAGAVFMLLGTIITLPRAGLGGAIVLIGVLFWIAGCISFKSFGWALGTPVGLALVGAVAGLIASDRALSVRDSALIYRQTSLTRLTHWVWAVVMFFMLLSGLQIFNARPDLYIGPESGFGYQNSILDIGAVNGPDGPRGQTKLFGHAFDTTGVLGVSGDAQNPSFTAFPGWATIPSYRDLGTGRVVHFFFAWILVGTLLIWLVNALATGHLWRDIILKPRDFRELPHDIVQHLKLRFEHARSYSPLQKFAYFGVFIIVFPLIIATGLAMSPGLDSAFHWLPDLFGGRQTARTIHFCCMLAFVLFVVVHVVMVVLANPINELRSMITGYYRIGPPPEGK
jgi:thiosulfate reductase cytochrome b subunit